ncbi:unnamed protein product [Caenorhabditis auriculariae]|uniref:Uncharacterized protein n=1 Tax=Caenorhabditis auriculariae TaxID=2777116 RepID=A0A8S1GY93_9PELO|nr:unnamed protein product [Caenorhabditis auriculariae]
MRTDNISSYRRDDQPIATLRAAEPSTPTPSKITRSLTRAHALLKANYNFQAFRAAVDNYKSPPRRRQDKTGDRQRTRSPPLDTAIPF